MNYVPDPMEQSFSELKDIRTAVKQVPDMPRLEKSEAHYVGVIMNDVANGMSDVRDTDHYV